MNLTQALPDKRHTHVLHACVYCMYCLHRLHSAACNLQALRKFCRLALLDELDAESAAHVQPHQRHGEQALRMHAMRVFGVRVG